MITERVVISALMRAFSPTVRAPSDVMLPSILPSTTRSFENLMLPLISTSVLRTLRPLDEALADCLDGLALLVGLGAGAAGGGGVSWDTGPVDEAPVSGFCPITF